MKRPPYGGWTGLLRIPCMVMAAVGGWPPTETITKSLEAKKKPRQTGGHWAGLLVPKGGTEVMGEGSAPSQLKQ